MKFISAEVVHERLIFKICGIKIFTHKLNTSIKKNFYVLIKKNGKKVYNPKIKGLTVTFRGGHNIVKLYEPLPIFCSTNFTLFEKNKIEIQHSKHGIMNLNIDALYNSKVEIGTDFSIQSGYFMVDDGATIKIGDDCMFSSNIKMKTGDSHVVFDGAKKEFIRPKSITVGNHVWFGEAVSALKGASIADGSIVGYNALVTKKFDVPNCSIAGNPARVLKNDIYWDIEMYWFMRKNKKEHEILDKMLKLCDKNRV